MISSQRDQMEQQAACPRASRRDVPSAHSPDPTTLDQHTPLASRQHLHFHVLLIFSRAVGDGEQQCSSIRKYLWPSMIYFSLFPVESCHWMRRAPAGRNSPEARNSVRREENGVVGRPASALACGRVTERDRRTPGDRNFLQFPVSKKSYPPSVWREKWRRCAFLFPGGTRPLGDPLPAHTAGMFRYAERCTRGESRPRKKPPLRRERRVVLPVVTRRRD